MNAEIFTHQPEAPLQTCPSGPLAGRRVLIQPDLSVKDWLTDAGSKALSGFHALTDATAVARITAAGAGLAGSTRMAELGLGINGSTMARALCEDYGDMGLVTDFLGEARMTACQAGWYGFKPSFGMISRLGLVGLVPSMECTGLVAQGPAEIAAAFSVIAGPDEKDFSMTADPLPDINPAPTAGSAPTRIGVPRQIREHLPETARKAFSEALEHAVRAGFDIREQDLPNPELFTLAHQVIASVEASSSCGKYDGVRFGFRAQEARNWNEMYLQSRGRAFGSRIKAFLFQGAYFQFENYKAFENACALRRKLVERLDEGFASAPLLALPARLPRIDPAGAETLEETYAALGLTLPASLAGLPALCIPGMVCDGASDLGLQLMGPRMSDARVLAAGQKIYSSMQGGCRE